MTGHDLLDSFDRKECEEKEVPFDVRISRSDEELITSSEESKGVYLSSFRPSCTPG
jgi:antitoxin component of RelBE/YafQ-DinJ toxin-antitoxin module